MKYIVAVPPVDFSRPFTELQPSDIHIYFHYQNEIGANTCKAACEHCYFTNQPTFHIPVERALAITASLRNQGYNIGMAPADSFADEALMAGDAGSAFRLKSIGRSAWTSGVPLYLPGWENRLNRAWEIGFRSIVISAHEAAGTKVPIKGVTKAPVILRAIRNMKAWNESNASKHFDISTTFTIRKDNCDLGIMRQMVAWALNEGINLARFNCFANFHRIPEHNVYEMSREDIIRFYGHLATLHQEFIGSPINLGISEDWGDAGIEQIYPYLPPVWQSRTSGWCSAGYRLFAMIEVDGQVVVVGCVDKWEPIMGRVFEINQGQYIIQWHEELIENLRKQVLENKVYACWGGVGYGREDTAGFRTSKHAEQKIFQIQRRKF